MRTPVTIATSLLAATLALSGCSGSAETATPSSLGPATGDPLVIATDFALGGGHGEDAAAANAMIELYLHQQADRAGSHPITLTTLDSSTSEDSWDLPTCARNAQDHVGNASEAAVVGTQASGCSKVVVPVLNQHPSGPMLIVSPADTDPGLTRRWAPGEPDIYYPTGERNYVRILPEDPDQGRAAAQFMADRPRVKKCYVIHDNEAYGTGVAKAFAAEAEDRGIKVVGLESWDPDARDYSELFELIGVTDPDCLFVGGSFDSNGARLMRDKVKDLGSNEKVLTIVPAEFGDDPRFATLEQAQGAFVAVAGLDLASLIAEGGPAAQLSAAYEQAQGELPPSSYPLYAVAATQVVLDAIARSDGTRQGVTRAVFGGDPVSIPAGESAVGTRIEIDPESGASNNRDLTILHVEDDELVVDTAWRLR